ncbi:MAG: hypothetical protein IJ446_01065 [Oscillospiraceae bacterium]|nr:hypothetical protein [Oscillospiraceae bacterium]
MKCKIIIIFIILYDLLEFLLFINELKPVYSSKLESMSKVLYSNFSTYISWSDRYSENNNIEPNTIIDGVYVIYIEKDSIKKNHEQYKQINYDWSIEDIANFLNMLCNQYGYGYYCIFDVNSSGITNVYTTTEKQTLNKILNNEKLSHYESVGSYPNAYDSNTSITSSNNVMKKIPVFATDTYFIFKLGMFIEYVIRINVFFIIVFVLFGWLKRRFSILFLKLKG